MNSKPSLPLRGIRILDLTSVLMGPSASQLIGEMGADVIKIESLQGDTTRQIGPGRHPGMGGIFINNNGSKRGIAVDLKTDAGRDVVLRLARSADVFFYNIRPQAVARLGLSYEALRAVNPRIVYAGVFGYGQEGPYAAKAAYDDLIQGAATLSSLFARGTGGDPQYTPAAIADRITGLSAVNAILAALLERQHSGEGQKIDVPMFETMVNFFLNDHLSGLTFEPPLDHGGYQRLLSGRRRPFRTLDGHVCAVVYTDRHWREFLKLQGRADAFATDPRMKTLAIRSQHVEALYAEMESVLATRTTAAWLADFDRVDIPALPMHDLDSIFSDPHLTAVDFFSREEHPSEGTLLSMTHPATWSRTQPRATRHAPRLGEHTREVLVEAGYAEAEIDALLGSGAVFGATGSQEAGA